MGFKSDIEIAQECEMQPITKIAEKAGIDDKYLLPGKIPGSCLKTGSERMAETLHHPPTGSSAPDIPGKFQADKQCLRVSPECNAYVP